MLFILDKFNVICHSYLSQGIEVTKGKWLLVVPAANHSNSDIASVFEIGQLNRKKEKWLYVNIQWVPLLAFHQMDN